MKKILFSIIFLIAAVHLHAQPQKGDWLFFSKTQIEDVQKNYRQNFNLDYFQNIEVEFRAGYFLKNNFLFGIETILSLEEYSRTSNSNTFYQKEFKPTFNIFARQFIGRQNSLTPIFLHLAFGQEKVINKSFSNSNDSRKTTLYHTKVGMGISIFSNPYFNFELLMDYDLMRLTLWETTTQFKYNVGDIGFKIRWQAVFGNKNSQNQKYFSPILFAKNTQAFQFSFSGFPNSGSSVFSADFGWIRFLLKNWALGTKLPFKLTIRNKERQNLSFQFTLFSRYYFLLSENIQFFSHIQVSSNDFATRQIRPNQKSTTIVPLSKHLVFGLGMNHFLNDCVSFEWMFGRIIKKDEELYPKAKGLFFESKINYFLKK